MEQNFYKDEFEQMLKDATEDFKMYPSRKVWHSIYNDLHPDRKWPSLAVCLLLLTAILYVGVSNNNSISKKSRNILDTSVNPASIISADLAENNSLKAGTRQSQYYPVSSEKGTFDITADAKEQSLNDENKYTLKSTDESFSQEVNALSITSTVNTVNNTKKDSRLPVIISAEVPVGQENTSSDLKNASNNIFTKQVNEDIVRIDASTKEKTNGLNIKASAKETAAVKEKKDKKIAQVFYQNMQEKVWVEDFAFHNVRNSNKWKTNLSFGYYITPSLGYRQLGKNNDYEPTNSLLLRTNDNEVVTQQAAPGFEAGLQLLFAVSKKLRLKTGLQYNYTNYITYAHELKHPSQTTVLMNNGDNGFVRPVAYNSNYGNILGSNFNRLNNTTSQVSLVAGADYKLAGNHKIKWYAGATVQPSYVAGGNAFLISADSKNFVEDASLLRRFNVNSSFETFVSIKTPGGIDINVGPQVHYQLLSTYSNEYSYTEKLYNLGLKIGVTKKL